MDIDNASVWKSIGAHLGHQLVLGDLEEYKCIFGSCKCWFECFQCLDANSMQLSGDLSFKNLTIHIWGY